MHVSRKSCLRHLDIPRQPPIMNKVRIIRNASSLSPDFQEAFLIPVVILAPTGYPLVIPIRKAKEAHPGTLKSGRITGSSNTPAARTKPVLFNTSETTKKGNRDGNTMLAHRLSPLAAASTAVLGNMMRHAINEMHASGSSSFLIYSRWRVGLKHIKISDAIPSNTEKTINMETL